MSLPASPDRRQQLALAALESERLRITILAGTSAVVMALAFVATLVLPRPRTSGGDGMPVTSITLAIGALVLYELAVRWVISLRITRQRPAPPAWWYVNAFVEVTLTTVILVSTRPAFDSAIHTLTAPAFGFYFALIILSILRLEGGLSAFTGAVAAVQYFAVAVLTVTGNDMPSEPLLGSVPYYGLTAASLLVAGLGAQFVAREVRRRTQRIFDEQRRRDQAIGVFGQFVSPALIDELLDKGELAGQRRRVCIMFLDIRGFTTFAEARDPAEVVRYIDTLFRFMAEIVEQHHGMIHQFQGDGFLAFFGAPLSHDNDCQNAVDAAFTLLSRVDAEVSAGRIPPTRIGIGLHMGHVVAGTIGSAVHREYAVTGDAVNLASRIEGLNKQFCSQILLSAEVMREIIVEGTSVVDLGPVEIRGRSGDVHLYRLA